MDPPKKQIKKGIPLQEIECKSDLVLRIFNNSPVCLKLETISKLENRGIKITIVTEFSKIEDFPKNIEIKKLPTSSATIQSKTGMPKSLIETAPASSGGKVNFYLYDDDLNTSPKGIDLLPTRGLLEFSINGVTISGPPTIQETGVDTGKFFVSVILPDSINGNPLSQDDVLEVKYFDKTDSGGENRITFTSIPLTNSLAKIQTSGGGNRIGHDFVVRIYEPDMNLDSKRVDKIPLNKVEFRNEGGIRTDLSNPVFSANSRYLLETGENTGIFEVIIKIPRTIDGKTVNIGDSYEFRYKDQSTPSDTEEEIKLKGKID